MWGRILKIHFWDAEILIRCISPSEINCHAAWLGDLPQLLLIRLWKNLLSLWSATGLDTSTRVSRNRQMCSSATPSEGHLFYWLNVNLVVVAAVLCGCKWFCCCLWLLVWSGLMKGLVRAEYRFVDVWVESKDLLKVQDWWDSFGVVYVCNVKSVLVCELLARDNNCNVHVCAFTSSITWFWCYNRFYSLWLDNNILIAEDSHAAVYGKACCPKR